jgi:hypothetical protein
MENAGQGKKAIFSREAHPGLADSGVLDPLLNDPAGGNSRRPSGQIEWIQETARGEMKIPL